MITVPVTAITAAICAYIFVWLSRRTIRLRTTHKVALGDNNVQPLQWAIRAHGNFAEYTPLAIIILFLNEIAGWPVFYTTFLAVLLVASRISHIYGMPTIHPEDKKEYFRKYLPFRVGGMVGTFTMLKIGALTAIIGHFIIAPADLIARLSS